MPETKHVNVVIIGGGPAGIGAAAGFARKGITSVLLIERAAAPGGVPTKYRAKPGGIPTFVHWTRARIMQGEDFAALLKKRLEGTDTTVWCEAQVISIDPRKRQITVVSPEHGKVIVTADTLILACGAREKNRAERGWITGHRPARVFYTLQVLDLLNSHDSPPMRRPVLLGSDLIAYSTAAKLKNAGAKTTCITDHFPSPGTSLPARWYFNHWNKPVWQRTKKNAAVCGVDIPEHVETDTRLDCDGIVISGELIPNSELAIDGGLKTRKRQLTLSNTHELSTPGWYAAGNIRGGFHGAYWCYNDGLRLARMLSKQLTKQGKS